MWQRLFNSPWPKAGDPPPRVQQQADARIRRYWFIQALLLVVGTGLLWLTSEYQQTAHARAYALPPLLMTFLLALTWMRHFTAFWLVCMVGLFVFQGMLIDGLGGVTSVSIMLPYTFASMLLPGRRRVAVQAVCVLAFWLALIYEIVPIGPQLEPRRLIFVSYNILIATLTFQTLRFLNRLAVELNTAYVAEEVTQRSQQFLARVSHELRTPLNSVLGFAKMLRRADLPEPQASYLRTIVEEGEQLNQLVSDLLDSAHLATGKLKLTPGPVEVNAVCIAVAGEIRHMLRPGVTLHTALEGGLPVVQADELRVRQIVRNILGNAAKYTTQGHITLRTMQRGDHVLIAVDDTGPGIPEDQREFVFAPFTKRDHRSGGVGLGLDIARQLARLHGGDITLESAVGQGSTFTVWLPVRPAIAPNLRSDRQASGSLESPESLAPRPDMRPKHEVTP